MKKSFWQIMKRCDWSKEGDDDAVLEPMIKYLSTRKDEEIFDFHQTMATYLYQIDGTRWFNDYAQEPNPTRAGFLYCRCVALINGKSFYNAVKNGEEALDGTLEFETILYVATLAWAKKHQCDPLTYPYRPSVSSISGSNQMQWNEPPPFKEENIQ